MELSFLDKRECDRILPRLFDLLHRNMSAIAPSGMNYEQERDEWLDAVAPAMQKAPRQIILMRSGDELIGYLQYYVNNGVFMVEEIQIEPKYQRTSALLRLCRFLCTVIPHETQFIEAYVHKQNHGSQAVIRSLGMNCADIPQNRDLLHCRGSLAPLFARFERRGADETLQ